MGPSIPDTLGPERAVLIIEVSSFQGLYYGKVQRIILFRWPVSIIEECPHLKWLDKRGSTTCINVDVFTNIGRRG